MATILKDCHSLENGSVARITDSAGTCSASVPVDHSRKTVHAPGNSFRRRGGGHRVHETLIGVAAICAGAPFDFFHVNFPASPAGHSIETNE